MLVIAALIGLAGAVTLAAFAGARRTETAYPRLLDHMHALDVLVSPDFGETVSVRESAKIPSVKLAGQRLRLRPRGLLGTWFSSPPDAEFGLERLRAVTPPLREWAPRTRVSPRGVCRATTEPDEIFVNEATAQMLGLHVGSRVHWSLYDFCRSPARGRQHQSRRRVHAGDVHGGRHRHHHR